jgi:hypothetical protein
MALGLATTFCQARKPVQYDMLGPFALSVKDVGGHKMSFPTVVAFITITVKRQCGNQVLAKFVPISNPTNLHRTLLAAILVNHLSGDAVLNLRGVRGRQRRGTGPGIQVWWSQMSSLSRRRPRDWEW